MVGTVDPSSDRSPPLYTMAADSSLANPNANVLRTPETLQNPPGITAGGLAERRYRAAISSDTAGTVRLPGSANPCALPWERRWLVVRALG